MSNRILDYPEATEITSDDYILLDNADTGAKCIKASALNINMDNYTIKEASGAIASFDDGEDLPLAFMGAYITAKQDLHGYDSPWVGGAGKNKLPLTVDLLKSVNGGANTWNNNSKEINGITYTIQVDDNGNVIGINANGTATSNSIIYLMGTSSPQIELSGQSVIISMSGFSKGAYKDDSWHDILSTSTGSTVTLNGAVSQVWGQINNGVTVNNIVLKPMIRLASVSDSTFAPYSNICPISGWSAVNVTRWGKNKITSITEGIELNSATGTTKDNTSWYVTDYVRVEYGKTFYLSGTSSSTVCYYDKNKTFTRHTLSSRIITPQEGEYYVRCNSLISGYSEPQIEEGTEATAFSPFGTDYTIQLGDTRYGGELDVTNGVLTVTYAKIALADITKSKYGSYQYGIRTISNFFDSIPNTTLMTGMSNTFVLSDSGESYNVDKCSVVFANGSSKTSFLISTQASGLSADASVTDINEWLRSIDAYMVYPLATPLTYQLTPQMIYSLIGENNIFADTGDSIVDYRKLWVKPEM